MISLRFDGDLAAQVPFLRLGGLLVEGVSGGGATPELNALIEATVAQTAASVKLEEISGLPGVAGWRKVMKALGTDPARYRISSERLLRRVVKGDGLPQVSLLVDLVNVWSVVTGLPIGLYDADRLAGSVLTFGAGRSGEAYLTLAGSELETAAKPVLRDEAGPCGSPLTDSQRTATHEGTTRCLAVVFGPPLFDDEEFERHMDLLADWMRHFAGGRVAWRSTVNE
ncbi:MAG: B3/4 domain-containing protein [Bacillota bacterium]